MLLYKWKYTNYKGEEKETEHYFNIDKNELVQMQISKDGGLDKIIEKAVQEKDPKVIIPLWTEMIEKSFGDLSADGESFIKYDEKTGLPLSLKFRQTAAFNALYMELLMDPKKAADFLKGIMPEFELTPEQKAIVDANAKKLSNAGTNIK